MTLKQGTYKPESRMSYKLGNKMPFAEQQDFGGQGLWLLENLFNVRASEETVPEIFSKNPLMSMHMFLHALDPNVVMTDTEYTVPHEYGTLPPQYLVNRFQGFVEPQNKSTFKIVIAAAFEYGEYQGAIPRFRLSAILKSFDKPEVYYLSKPSKHVMIYRSMPDLVKDRSFQSIKGFRLIPTMGEVLFQRKYLKHLFDPQFEGGSREDDAEESGVI